MKIGQLVMLVRTAGILPPTGSTGVIHDECCMHQMTRVMFGHHKNASSEDGAYCVAKVWLVPIDDDKGDIAKEDQLELDLTQQDLVKMGRKMLKELADAED